MLHGLSIKIPKTFFTEIQKSTLKFIWKYKRSQIAKAVLSKKSNTGGITIPNFKLFCRDIARKTTWYRNKNRQENQWIRIEDPDVNPCIYSQLIFDKKDQNI
jgi:uncharacterized protein (DUF736 family)